MKYRLFLMFTLLSIVLFSYSAFATEKVTLYAKDGRTVSVVTEAVEDFKNVGWYEAITVYALDGRTAQISPFVAEDWKAVGWYTQPVTTMYAPDGRTIIIAKTAVEDYKNVGWFSDKADVTVTYYAMDGRTKEGFIGNAEKEESVGWYINKEDVTTTYYAMDGRTKTGFIGNADKERAVGWYDNLGDVTLTLYAGGNNTRTVFKGKVDIEAEKSVGWYTVPPTPLYSMDGRIMYCDEESVDAYLNLGWYRNKEDTYQYVYALSATQQIPKAKVQDWVNVGWSTKPYPIMISGDFYTQFTGEKMLDLNITNISGKSIRSIYFDVYYYVGDLLYKNGAFRNSFSCLNTINPDNTEFMTVELPYITGCNILHIKNIRIRYTNGRWETVNGFLKIDY